MQPWESRVYGEMMQAFASKLEALDAEAWERVRSRCAGLDGNTLTAFFGRVELYSRTFTLDTDPYSNPIVRPALEVWGAIGGFASETIALVLPAESETARAQGPSRSHGPPPHPDLPDTDSHLRIETIARREYSRHPGTAGAIRAAARILCARRAALPPSWEPVYRPFEPEIPYASLLPPEPAVQTAE